LLAFILLLGLLPEFIQFSEDRTCEHVLDIDAPILLRVQEEEKLTHCGYYVEWVEILLKLRKLGESRD
jgi:hypothetical protein